MTDLNMWAMIVGFLLPPIVAVIQRPTWTASARTVITALVCLVVAFVTVFLQGNVHSGRQLVTTALLVLVTSIATYRGFWKPSGVAPVIERATSPKARTGTP